MLIALIIQHVFNVLVDYFYLMEYACHHVLFCIIKTQQLKLVKCAVYTVRNVSIAHIVNHA